MRAADGLPNRHPATPRVQIGVVWRFRSDLWRSQNSLHRQSVPTIAADRHASPVKVESVIAIDLIASTALIVTGERLRDIYTTEYTTEAAFLAAVAGLALTPLW